jgi:TRAP-type transport system periplasmic protein
VRTLWLACLIAAAVVMPAQRAARGQEIKISHQWAEGIDGRDRAVRVFVQEAEARAKGLRFRIYPNSSLNIPPTELLPALRNNVLDMAVYPLTYAIATVPEFSLAGLPGLVPNLDAAHALKGTEIHAMLQSLAEANGMHILTWWWAPGALFAKDRQIGGPATVRSLKMRGADPLFEVMLKEAGASVMNLPSTDIYAAMQSGRLDAIGTTYEAFMSLRLFEQAKFATVGPSLFMGFCPLVTSLATWNKLTPEQRVAIEEAASIADEYFETVERDLMRRVEKTLQDAGVTTSPMSHEDYLAWLAFAQRTAWVQYTKLNPRAQELLISTVRTFLVTLGHKDNVINSLFGEDRK